MMKMCNIFSALANKLFSFRQKSKLDFVNDIKLIALCPKNAILGYTNTDDRCFLTQNLILLILKFYVYQSRISGNFSFSAFFHKLVEIKNLENGTVLKNRRNLDLFKKEWSFIENSLQSE